jgi:NifB/MoaA-like Fe-S oxidoreductase
MLDQLEYWRLQSRQDRGCTLVYPSDEWYLVAGREVPTASEYDGFPQVENGVGMVRRLLDEWDRLKPDLKALELRPATLVCGTLIAGVMASIVEELNVLAGASLRLVPVPNRFFGAVTTVSGLLTGRDVVARLQDCNLGERVLLPRDMFTSRYGADAAPPGTTLDDMNKEGIAAQLGAPVEIVGNMTDALAALQVPACA